MKEISAQIFSEFPKIIKYMNRSFNRNKQIELNAKLFKCIIMTFDRVI